METAAIIIIIIIFKSITLVPQHPCDGGDHQLELPRTPHTLDAQLDTGDHDDYQVDQEHPGGDDHRHFDAP